MRANGIRRSGDYPAVQWVEDVGEATGQPVGRFDLVTFGSSFNVTDRPRALAEAHRILKPGGWFACMWNHRDLEEPLQAEVENLIRSMVPGYDYGSRREDQTEVIRASGLFEEAVTLSGRIEWTLPADEWVDAWRSHATLHRQAGSAFEAVIDAIARVVGRDGRTSVTVPYVTRIWAASAVVSS